MVKAGAEARVYLKVALQDVRVASYSEAPSEADGTPLDVVRLRYARLTDTYVPQRADGSPGTPFPGRYPHAVAATPDEKMPIKMLNDRLLVRIPDKEGERRSSGGILIPATAQMAKRLVWAEVVALGQNVRSAEVGDNVLFSPEDRYEVEVQGDDYIMLRERDLHAVAAKRIEASTGLYL